MRCAWEAMGKEHDLKIGLRTDGAEEGRRRLLLLV